MTKEDVIQINFCLWINHNYPDLLFWHTPSGGSRNKVEAMKLKRMATIRGVPDLFFPEWKLFIELKTEKGVISKDQKKVMEKLESVGYKCLVARGFEEAKEIVFNRDNL